jgi:hypothetical protein
VRSGVFPVDERLSTADDHHVSAARIRLYASATIGGIVIERH